ncbi:MAG TPA: c-type cytochrome [Gemmatimonadota bacterium]|nr:c-type cytochrome [Gemmatimonadota bacterium]
MQPDTRGPGAPLHKPGPPLSFRLAGLAVFAGLGLSAPAAGGAQQDWTWPERSENLRVLPEDFPAERLSAVMRGFTRALGVRCSYCHVGEEGQPLSTFDFASDDNPKKDIARTMYRMLGVINDTLATIEPSGPAPVNMWCHTCHRGRPRPTTLDEELAEVHAEEGIDATITAYSQLRERFYGRGAFDFGEGTLNGFGYVLLDEGRAEDAVRIFRLNVEQYPESANAWDSLGEGYLAAGDRMRAEEAYAKSLELDPDNENAREKLAEIRGG